MVYGWIYIRGTKVQGSATGLINDAGPKSLIEFHLAVTLTAPNSIKKKGPGRQYWGDTYYIGVSWPWITGSGGGYEQKGPGDVSIGANFVIINPCRVIIIVGHVSSLLKGESRRKGGKKKPNQIEMEKRNRGLRVVIAIGDCEGISDDRRNEGID